MKSVTYECKKCGKTCNGGGISYTVIETDNRAVVVISTDMDELLEHACGEEHAVQIFSTIMRKIKGQVDKPAIQTADRPVVIGKEKEGADVTE